MEYIKSESEMVDVLNFLRINPITTIHNLKDHLENHLSQLDAKVNDLQGRLLYMKKVRDRIYQVTEERKKQTVDAMLSQSNPNLLRYQEIAKNASGFKRSLQREIAYVPEDLVSDKTRRNMDAADRIAGKIGDMTRAAINSSLTAHDASQTLDLEQIQANRLIKLQANEIVGIQGERQRVQQMFHIASGAIEFYNALSSKSMTLDEALKQSVDYLMKIFGI